jgi:hypothetical protein
MPIARQLALKKMNDPGGYDRVQVNRLRGRADDAITEGEVLLEAAELEGMMGDGKYPFPRWTF